jgi:protein involved in polysaccharide export with SLBB domain
MQILNYPRRMTATAFALICLCSLTLRAQEAKPPFAPTSELGRANLSRVAASASDLKAILVKDTGLMVELKRWMAREATAQGQIITDIELSDEAVYDRLVTDVQFRSVATALVQRYGYLVPQLNPDSAIGKEQELVARERAKWVAQTQEEGAISQRLRSPKRTQQADYCSDSRVDNTDCQTQERPDRDETQSKPEPRNQEYPPAQIGPGQTVPQESPRNTGNIEHAQYSPGQTDFGTGLSDLPIGSASGTQSILGSSGYMGPSLGNGSDGSSLMDRQSDGADNVVLPISSGQQSRSVVDALAAYGVGTSRAMQGADPYASSRDEMISGSNSGNGGRYPTESMQPMSRRWRPHPASQPAPELVRATNPYSDIPSLYDMYVQAIPKPTMPKRFGSEVFENGTRDSQLIPMDLPAGPDYVVGPGDGLSIDLWGGVSSRIYRVVDREGRVSLPEVGPVLVSGKSLAEVQQNLQQTLRSQFRSVSADVSLARLRTIRVYEVGDVANPGAYDISSLSTPLNALFVAGGPTQKGSLRIVKHYRGNNLLEVVDLYDLLLHGVKSDLQRLENGDTVLVPPIGPQVTVEGMVRRPAIYELKDEKSLAGVLELSGGLLPTATLRHIEVQRLVAHQNQTMLSVDIPEADDHEQVAKELEAFQIQDGDRIRVFPIAPYNQDAVYLEGHVIRPGRYSYRANMKITDVVTSYKDLLPEPSGQYAEIIRLNAPDFHPTVESFDLKAALANPAQAPVLQPMDTVRIFSKFDFENAPTVSVLGDVRAPGTYKTAGKVHIADAVHLAGGTAPDAKVDDAQVFRYLPDGKMKIFSVNLNLALEGDPTANIWLEPRDRLLIHKNPDAVQPATALVQGDIGKPGRYPLTTNMTVADLIRVGGGLKPSADTQLADFVHYEWNQGQLSSQHQTITIAAALSGDPAANLPVTNGDVLTIRQLPGWNDIGLSITVKGEVAHPGTYGIRPGEKLSSVLARAGGFGPLAYPYGTVLMRREVRDVELNTRLELVRRLKQEEVNLKALPEPDVDQKNAKLTAISQTEQTIQQLQSNPPLGRVVVRIRSNVNEWRDTAADMPVRDGDTLVIPKKSDYVLVNGQVFNPTAVGYLPGRSARWYLSQAGGMTPMANKKAVFVIRGDGSVLGASGSAFWSGDSLGAALQPGDVVVVPEAAPRIGTRNWQTLFQAGQLATSAAIAVAYLHP